MSRPRAKPDAPPEPSAPLYSVVYEALRRSIAEGSVALGESLESEAGLSRRFGVSRITVRHALRLMESEGLIRKEKARRPVVVANQAVAPGGWIVESLDDIVAMVGDAQYAVQSWRTTMSPPDARLFGLPESTRLFCLRGVLLRDGQPLVRSVIMFPPDIGVQLRRDAFDDPVVFRVVQRDLGVRIADVEISVSAERAVAADAAVLPCAIGDPILQTQLRYRAVNGRLVEVAYSRGLSASARFATRLRPRSA